MTAAGPKTAYICGPLTELSARQRNAAKQLYTRLADAIERVTGHRAFVPHEHFDPLHHPHHTSIEVDAAERNQISKYTSLLVVVAVAPSWGGGIEVEIANRSGVPIYVLCGRSKLQAGRISRLLRGNPAVKAVVSYSNEDEAIRELVSLLRAAEQVRDDDNC